MNKDLKDMTAGQIDKYYVCAWSKFSGWILIPVNSRVKAEKIYDKLLKDYSYSAKDLKIVREI